MARDLAVAAVVAFSTGVMSGVVVTTLVAIRSNAGAIPWPGSPLICWSARSGVLSGPATVARPRIPTPGNPGVTAPLGSSLAAGVHRVRH